ncbi:ATP-grasp domain-containing protein [Sphingomonas arenae]|uniref:ATP-grasp domain-containing protein n=1 Tax=Sphingomonas arenae TaxID=2812555 RepID=UPI0019671F35|nr:ATP-grasp domain-containing protein [Sphingomonas arenae]
MTRVLVTGAGAVLGQGIIKALQRSTLQVEIASADPGPLSPGLFWTDRGYVTRLATDPLYLERFEQVLGQERPDVVLVGTDVELPILAEHRPRLEERYGTKILVSSPEVVRIADDKYETYRFCLAAGLDPPSSALPEEHDQLADLVGSVGFPLIVKPRVGARSAGVSVAHDAEELAAALAGRTGLVVQQVAGPADQEYTASALVFDGKAHASIVMRRDLRDGNTHRAFVEPYPELNAFVRRAAEALQPYGPVNFQFRTDKHGRPHIFEINARFSGATPLRALAGFNEVEMSLRHLLFDEPVTQPASLRQGTILRYLSETFVTDEDVQALRR